jgi:hypothetical protein
MLRPNPIHQTLIKLMSRPNGATITDIAAAKFKAPAIQALRLVGRRGYKTSVVKKSRRANPLCRRSEPRNEHASKAVCCTLCRRSKLFRVDDLRIANGIADLLKEKAQVLVAV